MGVQTAEGLEQIFPAEMGEQVALALKRVSGALGQPLPGSEGCREPQQCLIEDPST